MGRRKVSSGIRKPQQEKGASSLEAKREKNVNRGHVYDDGASAQYVGSVFEVCALN